jgi:DNA-binding transcriptional MerR regulator
MTHDVASYTSEDTARLTGAKAPQIEHLVRTGVVRPEREALRRGISRGYSLQNLAEIAIAARLLGVGLPVRAIALLMESVRGRWWQLANGKMRRQCGVLVIGPSTNAARSRSDFGPWEAVEFTTPETVAKWLREGNDGIVVNVLAILDRLEKETGELLMEPIDDFIAASRRNFAASRRTIAEARKRRNK